MPNQRQREQMLSMLASMTANKPFDLIVADTIKNEGGYVVDPDDPGGETKFGISKRSYPDVNIANLTAVDAAGIYERDYWAKPKFNMISNFNLARKVFDVGVTTGTKQSTKMLQRALNNLGAKVKVDGIIGNETLSAVNSASSEALLNEFRSEAEKYYVGLNRPKHIGGWLARLDR